MITNLGPSYARNVVLSDTLPDGTSFVTQTQLRGPAAVLSNTGNLLRNTIGALALGESAAFEVMADAVSIVGGERLKNTAAVTSDSADPNPGNHNDSSSVETIVQVGPAIVSPASTIFNVGTAGLFTVTATGYVTPALTYKGTLPSLVTLVDNRNGTATLSGTPVTAEGGVYHIVITAANTIKPDAVQNFDLTVN